MFNVVTRLTLNMDSRFSSFRKRGVKMSILHTLITNPNDCPIEVVLPIWIITLMTVWMGIYILVQMVQITIHYIRVIKMRYRKRVARRSGIGRYILMPTDEFNQTFNQDLMAGTRKKREFSRQFNYELSRESQKELH